METHTVLAIIAAPFVADLIRRYHSYKYPFDGSFLSRLFLFLRLGSGKNRSGPDVGGNGSSSSSSVPISQEKASGRAIAEPAKNGAAE